MDFPLHLGVTEAGDGNMGRIKSAVGIGALLADGLGDTIRVSLTEPPEDEIPAAKMIAEHYINQHIVDFNIDKENEKYYPEGFVYERRKSIAIMNIGGDNVPVVFGREGQANLKPEYVIVDDEKKLCNISEDKIYITESNIWKKYRNSYPNLFPVFNMDDYCSASQFSSLINFLKISLIDLGKNNEEIRKNLELISSDPSLVIILEANSEYPLGERRAFFMYLNKYGCKNPVVMHLNYDKSDNEAFIIKSAADAGIFFIDGLGDGLWLENKNMDEDFVNSISFDILQACRVRLTKPDYISCPGCGRTLFHLQETTAQIRKHTSHLKGLKIAVMGCIVNGPGEMADADYGYVGISTGKINLYKNRIVVKKNIPEDKAVDELIKLIKAEGDWQEEINN
jgi:(E)-4-hydroxy-3-methylbut-2-enyl-diphosphate synthase